MAEHVVDQGPEITAVEDEIVGVVLRQIRIAVAAQIGNDDLVACLGEGPDVAPPDALRLGIAVDEQERMTADAFADVGELEVAIDPRAMDLERVGGGRRGLGRAEIRHEGGSSSGWRFGGRIGGAALRPVAQARAGKA
jgi:hypothetical protein